MNPFSDISCSNFIPLVNITALTCDGTPNGGVRLSGGTSDREGRVEICIDGSWGTICDNFWSDLDASVVCYQLNLGRTDATAIQNSQYGPGTGPIFFDSVFCFGTEEVFTDCSLGKPQGCTHSNDASVVCSGK